MKEVAQNMKAEFSLDVIPEFSKEEMEKYGYSGNLCPITAVTARRLFDKMRVYVIEGSKSPNENELVHPVSNESELMSLAAAGRIFGVLPCPSPDNSLSLQDMKDYGYYWKGMYPISEPIAKKLFGKISVYALFQDNSEALIGFAESITLDADNGVIFGVECIDWLNFYKKMKQLQIQDKVLNSTGERIKVAIQDMRCNHTWNYDWMLVIGSDIPYRDSCGNYVLFDGSSEETLRFANEYCESNGLRLIGYDTMEENEQDAEEKAAELAELYDAKDKLCAYCELNECENCIITQLIESASTKE